MPRWQGVRRTTDLGAACIQSIAKNSSIYPPKDPLPNSEDCLSLNICSPRDARRVPVLVWIHGGALLTGSSREDLYDGCRLAERGIVVVSINCRLGALGWLAHPGLSADDPRKLSGNYGLLDQRRCAGCGVTSPRSGAIPPTSRSRASRRVRSASPT